MIVDERPYIKHDGVNYKCYLAGYMNPVQHKWSFVIAGDDNPIFYGEKIEFMGHVMSVTFTNRRDKLTTEALNTEFETETYIEAWIL